MAAERTLPAAAPVCSDTSATPTMLPVTSFVPAVQRLFLERFGAEKLTSADQFESISRGLAMIGLTADPQAWAVAA